MNNDEIDSQIHAGRREKLRSHFIKNGLSKFNECEVIEFALGFCMPRIDTNPLAHRLINKFGSLPNVIDANPTDLENVTGIGKNAAIFLSFLKQITTYVASSVTAQVKINSISDAAIYLAPLMKTYSVEQFVLLCLDKAGRVLLLETKTSDELDKVHVNIRKFLQIVLRVKTATLIISHNHLDDNPEPSAADILLTRQLVRIFSTINIDFADHIIFSGNGYYSFYEHHLIDTFKQEHAELLHSPFHFDSEGQ